MNSKLPHAPLTSLIIDDDVLAHDEIKRCIAEIDWMDQPQSCLNPVKAIDMIALLKPDVIFLDIEMPYLSGTELLDILGPSSPPVIMTTAHRGYAFQGYQYEVEHFLEKPITLKPLLKALRKIRLAHIVNNPALPINAPIISPDPSSKKAPLSNQNTTTAAGAGKVDFSRTKMLIRKNDGILSIKYDELYMVRSDSSYLELFTKTGIHLIRKGLKELLDFLPHYFIQTHRSYIVNSEFIEGFSYDTVTLAECSEDAKISKRFKRNVYKKLGNVHG